MAQQNINLLLTETTSKSRNLPYEDIVSIRNSISELLMDITTRYKGLEKLENYLKNHSSHCLNKFWKIVIRQNLQPEYSTYLKSKTCDVIQVIVETLPSKTSDAKSIKNFVTSLILPLLQQANGSQWIHSAIECLYTIANLIPESFVNCRDAFEAFLLNQMASVSARTLEVVCECFTALPYCSRNISEDSWMVTWYSQYTRTLESLYFLFNKFLYTQNNPINYFPVSEDCVLLSLPLEDDMFGEKDLKYFGALCKCLAKMLSASSRYHIVKPVEKTMQFVIRLYNIEDDVNLKFSGEVNSCSVQDLQMASVVIIEAIINKHDVRKISEYITELLRLLLKISKNFRPLRTTAWALYDIWIREIQSTTGVQKVIFEELEDDLKMAAVSVKSASTGILKYKSNAVVADIPCNGCAHIGQSALKVAGSFLLVPGSNLEKRFYKELWKHTEDIARSVQNTPMCVCKECAKVVYDLLFAMVIADNSPSDMRLLQKAVGFLKKGIRYPDAEVRKVCFQGMAVYRKLLSAKRPVPVGVVSQNEEEDTSVKQDARIWAETISVHQNSLPMNIEAAETLPPANVSKSNSNVDEENPHQMNYTAYSPPHLIEPSQLQSNGGDSNIMNSSQDVDKYSENVNNEGCFEKDNFQNVLNPAEDDYLPTITHIHNVDITHEDSLNEHSQKDGIVSSEDIIDMDHSVTNVHQIAETYNSGELVRETSVVMHLKNGQCSGDDEHDDWERGENGGEEQKNDGREAEFSEHLKENGKNWSEENYSEEESGSSSESEANGKHTPSYENLFLNFKCYSPSERRIMQSVDES